MSTRAAIRNLIPRSWESVLLKHRCMYSFINQMYEHCIPVSLRNKYHCQAAIRIIRLRIKTGRISNCLDIYVTKEGSTFWTQIEEEINNLEETWR